MLRNWNRTYLMPLMLRLLLGSIAPLQPPAKLTALRSLRSALAAVLSILLDGETPLQGAPACEEDRNPTWELLWLLAVLPV